MMSVPDMLRCLVQLTGRACHIARTVRSEPELFRLLVEEKTGADKNARFVHDFKTVADVLIQEMVRHEIEVKFPAMAGNVFGEESNKFTTPSGQIITVSVNGNQKLLTEGLTTILDGNKVAAQLLTDVVYDKAHIDAKVDLRKVPNELIDTSNLGAWIDPIDGTNVYIKADANEPNHGDGTGDISRTGLDCVTVLIGLFDKTTKQPVLGVVGKPFVSKTSGQSKWSHDCYWGSLPGLSVHSKLAPSVTPPAQPPDEATPLTVVISRSEASHPHIECLKAAGCRIAYSAGAGYKQLCVILGLADVYLLMKPMVFQWDTCAPHAILRAIGGGVVNFRRALDNAGELSLQLEDRSALLDSLEVVYDTKSNSKSESQYAHLDGIIAYRSQDRLIKLLSLLKKPVHL